MARYIDADKFAEDVCVFNAIDEHSANAVISLLHRQPTADIVEVVRCEKCKYCDHCYPAKAIDKEPVEGWYCNLNSKYVLPTHFCSYGERREE